MLSFSEIGSLGPLAFLSEGYRTSVIMVVKWLVSVQHRVGNPMPRDAIVSRWAVHGRLTVAVHGDRHPCHRTPDPVITMELNSYNDFRINSDPAGQENG